MRSHIRLFKISGIEVGIHPTWFFAFALIAWAFATGLLPRQSPGWTTTEYWIAGAAGSALLFVSVLVHELAHSFTARFLGLSVHGITLFLFGGVSRIGGEVRHARTEFLVAFSGPASSLAIGGLCLLYVAQADDGRGPQSIQVGIISILGYMNLFLGAFNLLPGHPLDGGRVLRSLIWGATRNPALAGNVVSVSGRAIAIGMVALGAFLLIQGESLSGIWMIFLGVFLLGSASRERADQLQSHRSVGAHVSAAVVPAPPPVDYSDTLDSVARLHFVTGSAAVVPVTRHGELVGFLDSWDARKFDQVDWPNITVGPLVEQRGFTIADPGDSAEALRQRLLASGHRSAAVFSGSSFLGVATLDTLVSAVSGT